MKFATKPVEHYHFTLGMFLHYLGKLKIRNFCRYQQIWKKMQTSCIFVVFSFVIDPQILIFLVFNIAVNLVEFDSAVRSIDASQSRLVFQTKFYLKGQYTYVGLLISGSQRLVYRQIHKCTEIG